MSEYLKAAGSWKLEAESKSWRLALVFWASSFKLQASSFKLQASSFKLQASGFKLPAASKTIYPSVEPEA
ncbi:hypothetical protein [Pseudomonas citronellolis]|uniref:hypothetical protein n=1 Tax=Pseudomonas citronellolis TaxID=53408 RepID=UPI00128FA39B|nr:hypothetical protein [Pseudomonas citronellolis]